MLVDPESVAKKVGVCPETGLLNESLNVMVIVEFAVPSATTGVVPEMVEFVSTAAVGTNVTTFPVTATGEVNCSVLASAKVEASVQTERPLPLEAVHAPYMFVVLVSVALKIGETPETGLLNASLKIIEIEEEEIPSAFTGVVPEIVVVKLLTLPGLKITMPSVFAIGLTIESVLTSALIEERVHVEIPDAFVTEHAP